jgi:hypothetical protein
LDLYFDMDTDVSYKNFLPDKAPCPNMRTMQGNKDTARSPINNLRSSAKCYLSRRIELYAIADVEDDWCT